MKVVAVQMVSEASVSYNIERAEKLIVDAVEKGAELIVLPENFASLGSQQSMDQKTQQRCVDWLQNTAKSHNVWVVGGTLPLSESLLNRYGRRFHKTVSTTAKPFATTLVFDSPGNAKASYCKTHLFDANVDDETGCYRESDQYTPGVEKGIVESPWCNLGIAVCYDLRFPEYFRLLVSAGAKVILIPAAFTYATGSAHWEVLLRARAIETQCYIVASNQGGEHKNGRKTWGETMIVSPWGEVLAKMGLGEGVVFANLDIHYVDQVRREIPLDKHRRF